MRNTLYTGDVYGGQLNAYLSVNAPLGEWHDARVRSEMKHNFRTRTSHAPRWLSWPSWAGNGSGECVGMVRRAHALCRELLLHPLCTRLPIHMLMIKC